MTRLAALALVAALLVTSAVAQSSFTQKDFPASPTPVLMGTSFQVVLQANVVQCPTPPGVCDEQATYTLQSTSDPILSISPSSVAFSDSQREQVVTVTIGAADVSPGVVSSVWTTTADNWVANVGIGSFTVLKRGLSIGDIQSDCDDGSCPTGSVVYGLRSVPLTVGLPTGQSLPSQLSSIGVSITFTEDNSPGSPLVSSCTATPSTLTLSNANSQDSFTFVCNYNENDFDGANGAIIRFTISDTGFDLFPDFQPTAQFFGTVQNVEVLNTGGDDFVVMPLPGSTTEFRMYMPQGGMATGSSLTITPNAWGLSFTPSTITFNAGQKYSQAIQMAVTDTAAVQVDRTVNFRYTGVTGGGSGVTTSDVLSFYSGLSSMTVEVPLLPTPVFSAFTDGTGSLTLWPGQPAPISLHTVVPTPTSLSVTMGAPGLEFSTDNGGSWSNSIGLTFTPTVTSNDFWVRVSQAAWAPGATGSTITAILLGADASLYSLSQTTIPVTVQQYDVYIEPNTESIVSGQTTQVVIGLSQPPPYTDITVWLFNRAGWRTPFAPATGGVTFDQTSPLVQTYDLPYDISDTPLDWDQIGVFITSSGGDDRFFQATLWNTGAPAAGSVQQTSRKLSISPPDVSAVLAVDGAFPALESGPVTIYLEDGPTADNGLQMRVWAPYMTATPSTVQFTAGQVSASFSFVLARNGAQPQSGGSYAGGAVVPNLDYYVMFYGPEASMYTPTSFSATLPGGFQTGTVSLPTPAAATVGVWNSFTVTVSPATANGLTLTPMWVDPFVEFQPATWDIAPGTSSLTVQWRATRVFSNIVTARVMIGGADAAFYQFDQTAPASSRMTFVANPATLSVDTTVINLDGTPTPFTISIPAGAPAPPNGLTVTPTAAGVTFTPATIDFVAGQRVASVEMTLAASGSAITLPSATGDQRPPTVTLAISGADAAWYQLGAGRTTELSFGALFNDLSVVFAGNSQLSTTSSSKGLTGLTGLVSLDRPTTNGLTLTIHSACLTATPLPVVVPAGASEQSFSYDLTPFAAVTSADLCSVEYQLSGPDAPFFNGPADSSFAASAWSRNIYIEGTTLSSFAWTTGPIGFTPTVGQASPRYAVQLSAPPSSGLTLTFHSDIATFDPPMLTFTPSLWAATVQMTPTRTTPIDGTMAIGYSVGGADAGSYFANVDDTRASLVATPALMFGQLHSLPLTAAASSWVSVNAPAGSWEPFTIVLGCSNDATPLQNGAQNRFVFNPPVLSFDPALPGTRNQTFSYRPNYDRYNNVAQDSVNDWFCTVSYQYIPRSRQSDLGALTNAQPEGRQIKQQLVGLSVGRVFVDIPATFRQGEFSRYCMMASPAAQGELRVVPSSPNLLFEPPILVIPEGQVQSCGFARLLNQARPNTVLNTGNSPYSISFSLDGANGVYTIASPIYVRDDPSGAAALVASVMLVLAALVAVL